MSETDPGTERSMPPCWTTRVCPSATIARTAANGSIPSSAPRSRLVGASRALATRRAATATRMVIRPRDRAIRRPAVTEGCAAVSAAMRASSVRPLQ